MEIKQVVYLAARTFEGPFLLNELQVYLTGSQRIEQAVKELEDEGKLYSDRVGDVVLYWSDLFHELHFLEEINDVTISDTSDPPPPPTTALLEPPSHHLAQMSDSLRARLTRKRLRQISTLASSTNSSTSSSTAPVRRDEGPGKKAPSIRTLQYQLKQAQTKLNEIRSRSQILESVKANAGDEAKLEGLTQTPTKTSPKHSLHF